MKSKHIAVVSVVAMFLTSYIVVLFWSGLPGATHVGGIINVGLAVAFVHTLDQCDDRYSLYNEIIEEKNTAVAIAYSGIIIGACVAFPNTVF
jgi:hypothetical protein